MMMMCLLLLVGVVVVVVVVDDDAVFVVVVIDVALAVLVVRPRFGESTRAPGCPPIVLGAHPSLCPGSS